MKFQELHGMDPHEFEILVGQLFIVLGYSVVLTSRTSDGGVDLIVDQQDQSLQSWTRHIIQVKRYKSPIGVEKVRELNGVMELHKATHGTLITLSQFKRGVKVKTRSSMERISLLDGAALKKLFIVAKMLDDDGVLANVSDPNLECNRRFAVLNTLRHSQPKQLSANEIGKSLGQEFHVTVPQSMIIEDIESLQKQGRLVELSGLQHYVPCQSEVGVALKGLPSILAKQDYFFRLPMVYEVLQREFSVSADLWRLYFEKQVKGVLSDLVSRGALRAVDTDLYASPLAIDVFRDTNLTSKEIGDNFKSALGVTEDNGSTQIGGSHLYPTKENGIMIQVVTRDGRKLLPFLNIEFTRCPHCDHLHIHILELISLYVTCQEIEDKLTGLKDDTTGVPHLQAIAARFEMSRMFVERLHGLLRKYFPSPNQKMIQVQAEPFAILHNTVDAEETDTLDELVSTLAELGEKHQSLMNEIYAVLKGFGRPQPVLRIQLGQGESPTLTRITPLDKKLVKVRQPKSRTRKTKSKSRD